MQNQPINRRQFIATTSTILATSALPGIAAAAESKANSPKLALEGGARAVRKAPAKAARFGAPERERLDAMLGQDSLFYWQGPQTKLLTERVKSHHPFKYVMPCSSGTAAVHIAVAAAGIGPGDEVITSPITDMGTVIGILFQQGVPVFADLEPDTYNLSVADVARRITPKTKAIVAVHLAGNPCDLDGLKALADKHQLVLIEDSAQAWGAKYQGKPLGSVGHMSCFSLQNSKQLTCGDGGIVASNDDRFGPLLQKFGDKGFDRTKGKFEVFATNYRMSEPQAAMAAGQMTRLEAICGTRSRLGKLLSAELAGIPGITPHRVAPEDRCTHYFYMMRFQPGKFRCRRVDFVKALSAEGVPASSGYIPTVIYQMDVFRQHSFFAGRWLVREMGLTEMDYNKVKCPEAEAILTDCIRIQIHESMDDDYIREVAGGIRKVAKHYAIG